MSFAIGRDSESNSVLAWVSLAVASALALVFCLNPVLAHGLGDSDTDEGVYSFYYTSGMSALYYEQGLAGILENGEAGEGEEAPSDFKDVSVAFQDAGGMLGFPDAVDDSWFGLGAFTSKLADGAQVYSYDGFPASSTFANFRAFGIYGKLLGQLGLDETADVGGNALLMIVRFLMGALLLIPYALASFVDLAFIFSIKLLQQLNPFALFSDIWDVAASSGAMESLRNGAFGPIIAFVGGLYRGAIEFAWAVSIPALFLVTVVGYLLFHTRRGSSQTRGSGVRQLVVKVLFIGLALPILGGAYTGFLDMVEDLLTNSTAKTTNANYVLQSTLVNFADWAENDHLGLPSGAQITGGPKAGVVWSGTTPPRLLAQMVNGVSDYTTDSYAVSDTGNITTWFQGVTDGFGFITTYMTNKDYNETDFETTWKGLALKDSNTGDESAKALYEGLEGATKMDTYKDAETGLFLDDSGSDDSLKYVFLWDGDPSALSCVSQTAAQDHGGLHRTGLGVTGAYVYTGNCSIGDAPTVAGVRAGTSGFGLSTSSMYNYLRSSFGDDSFTCFSSDKVSTILSRVTHKAVCAVGDPMNRLTNVLSAVFELLALAVVGWGYAFGLIFAVVTRGIKMITGLPGAMMGSMKHMVKLVLYVVMMAAEIVVTIALYALVSQFILVINDLFTYNVIGEMFGAAGAAVGGALQGTAKDAVGATIDWTSVIPSAASVGVNFNNNGGFSGSGGPIIDLVMGIASCIVSIIFVLKAFQIRKKVLATTMSSVDSAVNGLFKSATGGASGTASVTGSAGGGGRSGGGGILGTAARGVAAGMGMGAGSTIGRAVGGAIVDGASKALGGGGDADGEGGVGMEVMPAEADKPSRADTGESGEEDGPSGEELASSDGSLSGQIVAEEAAARPAEVSAVDGAPSTSSTKADADLTGGQVSADGGTARTAATAEGDVASTLTGETSAETSAEGGEGGATDVRGAQTSVDADMDGEGVPTGEGGGGGGGLVQHGTAKSKGGAHGSASGTDYSAGKGADAPREAQALTPEEQRRLDQSPNKRAETSREAGDAAKKAAAAKAATHIAAAAATGGGSEVAAAAGWVVHEGGAAKAASAAGGGGGEAIPAPQSGGFSMGGGSTQTQPQRQEPGPLPQGAQQPAPARSLETAGATERPQRPTTPATDGVRAPVRNLDVGGDEPRGRQ